MIQLGYNLTYKNLFTNDGLQSLDERFISTLSNVQKDKLIIYRAGKITDPTLLSDFLIEIATELEPFLAKLFDIEKQTEQLQQSTISYNPVANFKKQYVQLKAKKRLLKEEELINFDELENWLHEQVDLTNELEIAKLGLLFLENNEDTNIEKLTQWCIQAIKNNKNYSFLKLAKKLDYQNLIPLETDSSQRKSIPQDQLKQRDGFALTDNRMSAGDAQNEVNYCVFCHEHDGDFCSKGFPLKKKQPELGLKQNPLDITLTGCPLEEKISEMNILKREGLGLASLAMVMVDNPMCPATGHRICNDCMKACIYQKQTPVNIPEIETRVLTDVLDLPYGVEIYDLLTRWNPLRQDQWITKPYNGKKILIAGMGPAGFTLAHHLLQEGFAVVGFDGLKIEALPENLLNQPIKHFDEIKENLDDRLIAGFGGVAEYGITVRWDKNFLKLIYITLMRRQHFQVFGNVRFGGTVTVEDAWELGFDHMVVAVGAGLPRALPIKNSLATGMRQANDFLMALQLTGAAKKNSLANLQLRLPAIIIGGGLTGVDTATEAQAYYIRQVEKISDQHQDLLQKYSETEILEKLDDASKEILIEFLGHANQLKQERELAKKENRATNFIKLLRNWGGVTIVYRKTLQDSPAYRNNHEELHKALAEGVYYVDCLEPKAVNLDQHKHCSSIDFVTSTKDVNGDWSKNNRITTLPAKSILVATGASLNVAYSFEHPGTFERANMQYQRYENNNGNLELALAAKHCKSEAIGPFTSYHIDDKRVSFIGDTHPVFHGNVVKAIASAKRTYPEIVKLLANNKRSDDYQEFSQIIKNRFNTVITNIERKNKKVIEVTIKAPQVIKHYQPGNFCRIQNYETTAQKLKGKLLQSEAMAASAIEVNKETSEITLMIVEDKVSARLVATYSIGDRVALMGPTGVRSKVSDYHEKVLLIGNLKSLATIRNYGKALKAANNDVVFLGYFEDAKDVYCQTEIENICDEIIWCSNKGSFTPTDHSVFLSSGPLPALLDYAQDKLSLNTKFIDIDRIQVIGDYALLQEIQKARHHELSSYLPKNPKMFGSVSTNMQCMLKGVCAQCLQWQIDPHSGQRTKAVYACSWQDQPLELIDFESLNDRLQENKLAEYLSNLWLDSYLKTKI